MKTANFLSVSSAIASLMLLPSGAKANVAPDPIEMHVHLAHEDVHCVIKGDEAVVTGTFTFNRQPEGFNIPVLYLPVYAEEGTPEEQMKPDFIVDGIKAEVDFINADREKWARDRYERVKKHYEEFKEHYKNKKPTTTTFMQFGELPQIEGQRVYWFYVHGLPQQPVMNASDEPQQLTVKIRYAQKLSKGKFIYTPLIPNQKEGKDYGSITVSADRPLTLIDAEKHSFAKDGDKYVIEPFDKRGIVVEVAEAKATLP